MNNGGQTELLYDKSPASFYFWHGVFLVFADRLLRLAIVLLLAATMPLDSPIMYGHWGIGHERAERERERRWG